MPMFKRFAFVMTVVAGMTITQPVVAQQPAPSADAVAVAAELLTAMGTEKQFEAVLPMIFAQLRQVIAQSNPTAAKELDAAMPSFAQKFAARKSEVIPMIAQVYARRLTVDDMKAMTTFFKSPAGQRFVETMPQLTQDSMAIGNAWGRTLGEEIEREMREELRRRGINL